MTWYRRCKTTNKHKGLLHGYRSGLEEAVQEQLRTLNVPYEYEPKDQKIQYTVPESSHLYTPDFVLPNGIIIETKGRFLTADRKKHLLIKAQRPELDIRFVFQNPNGTPDKRTKTTYAQWCQKHGFLYATKLIPIEWINEKKGKDHDN